MNQLLSDQSVVTERPAMIGERFGWIPATSATCPPVEEIRRIVDEDLGILETRDLVDHLSGCRSCFGAWRAARARRWGEILGLPVSAS